MLQWKKMGHAHSCWTPHRKHWLLESHAGVLSAHVVARFPRYGHCPFTLPMIWEVASSQKTILSTKSFSSIFNCISSQKSRLFTLSAGVRACTNRILYSLKHSSLSNTFHTVIFGMSNSLLALATDLQGNSLKSLSHSLNVVIRHTRSTRTLAFTQASSFHKLSVPPSYVIPVWHVFSKPCTKLTMPCNHRSRHL